MHFSAFFYEMPVAKAKNIVIKPHIPTHMTDERWKMRV
jgi:hypothetical protein